MNGLVIRFSGGLLMLLLAMLLLEILCVGVFAAGWCLHTLFGPYGFAVVGLIALAAALAHHHHAHAQDGGRLLGGH